MKYKELETFYNRLEKYGPYVRNCANLIDDLVLKSISQISDVDEFTDAFGIFLNNAYIRGVDVEVGDNIALLSSYIFTRDSIQNQLNRHHFGNSGTQHDVNLPYMSLENFFNIHSLKNVCDRNIAVLSNKVVTVADPLHLTNVTRYHQCSLITIMDFKNVTKSLEGILMYAAGFTLNGTHNVDNNISTVLLVLNQCTRACIAVPRNEKISPLTRNGNEYTLDPRCGLVIIGYEGCLIKLKKMEKATAIDNLSHQFSRYMTGMPTNSGMSFFDIVII